MGTELMKRGMRPGECGMLWNVNHSAAVVEVHQAYRDAGCRLIISNSFGGSRSMLERHHQGGRTAELNRKAAELARKAAGPEAWVLGDVGPFGDFLEPMGDMTKEELEGIFTEQIAALVEGGADAILVETMVDPGEVAVAANLTLVGHGATRTFIVVNHRGGFISQNVHVQAQGAIELLFHDDLLSLYMT
jgi:5-methyltetrahydrofolate--homocysteine methyltransferase